MSKLGFNPEKDIPDLSGKVILVTGGTSGVGKETIQYLLPHSPAHIVFTGRNKSAADSIAAESAASYPNVKITFIPCDLGSLASVKTASETVLSSITRLDLLLCVAGIMCHPPTLSTDGYEIQFATNHMGHALLIKLLLPLLQKTTKEPNSDVRIVLTTSLAANPPLPPPGGIQFDLLKTTQPMFFGTWRRYAQSKLANLVYARALAKHSPDILVTSVHPGIAYTGLMRELSWSDRIFTAALTFGRTQLPHELAWNGLWTAVEERAKVENGAFYLPVGQKVDIPEDDVRGDEQVEKKLWDFTEAELARWM